MLLHNPGVTSRIACKHDDLVLTYGMSLRVGSKEEGERAVVMGAGFEAAGTGQNGYLLILVRTTP